MNLDSSQMAQCKVCFQPIATKHVCIECVDEIKLLISREFIVYEACKNASEKCFFLQIQPHWSTSKNQMEMGLFGFYPLEKIDLDEDQGIIRLRPDVGQCRNCHSTNAFDVLMKKNKRLLQDQKKQ